ncbi:MAG TPA: universal stress protein [Candidatus Cybelea sp.]|nr:universal stress protein [Candidatus Cybelea sp.]
MRRILMATDGSEGAARAVAVAADMAKAAGARLTIVTVGDSADSALEPIAKVEGDLGAALDLVLNRNLLDAQEIARKAGVAEIKTQITWGDPSQAIINAAMHSNADAIVIGRRGLGQLEGLLLGSVSQKLVTHAPCTVIVVP